MLNGKVALVTGAARHTGAAIAAELLRHGATVYLNDVDEPLLAQTADRLGSNATAVATDLSDEGRVRAMMDRLLKETGRLDILVNNACHQGIGPGFLDTPLSLLDEVLAVNLRAGFLLSQLAATNMIEREEGSIINISSNTAERALQRRTTYIASKGAVNALTRAMAVELGPYGVRVNAIAPGYIFTSRWEKLEQPVRDRRRANIPLGREANGNDIARAVVFFASSMSGNATGTVLTIDGGASNQLFPADLEA